MFVVLSLKKEQKRCCGMGIEPDVNRTRNLLIWSQTRYHCATDPLVCFLFGILFIVISFSDKPFCPFLSWTRQNYLLCCSAEDQRERERGTLDHPTNPNSLGAKSGTIQLTPCLPYCFHFTLRFRLELFYIFGGYFVLLFGAQLFDEMPHWDGCVTVIVQRVFCFLILFDVLGGVFSQWRVKRMHGKELRWWKSGPETSVTMFGVRSAGVSPLKIRKPMLLFSSERYFFCFFCAND